MIIKPSYESTRKLTDYFSFCSIKIGPLVKVIEKEHTYIHTLHLSTLPPFFRGQVKLENLF